MLCCLLLHKNSIALSVSVSSTFVAVLNLCSSGGIFFYQESFVLQHASAIFEWVYCMLIMLFYGTFAFEFVNLSGDTLMVLSKRAAGHNYPSHAHKTEVGGGATDNQPETML